MQASCNGVAPTANKTIRVLRHVTKKETTMTSNCSKLKSTHEFRSVIFPHKNVTQATTKDPQNASTTTIGSWQSQEPIKWSLHLPYKPLESALSRVRYRRIYVDEYVHQIIEWTEGKKNKSIHLYGLQIPLPPRKERRLPTQPPKITAAGYSCKHEWAIIEKLKNVAALYSFDPFSIEF